MDGVCIHDFKLIGNMEELLLHVVGNQLRYLPPISGGGIEFIPIVIALQMVPVYIIARCGLIRESQIQLQIAVRHCFRELCLLRAIGIAEPAKIVCIPKVHVAQYGRVQRIPRRAQLHSVLSPIVPMQAQGVDGRIRCNARIFRYAPGSAVLGTIDHAIRQEFLVKEYKRLRRLDIHCFQIGTAVKRIGAEDGNGSRNRNFRQRGTIFEYAIVYPLKCFRQTDISQLRASVKHAVIDAFQLRRERDAAQRSTVFQQIGRQRCQRFRQTHRMQRRVLRKRVFRKGHVFREVQRFQRGIFADGFDCLQAGRKLNGR